MLPFCCLRAAFLAERLKLRLQAVTGTFSVWIISAEGAGPNDIAPVRTLPQARKDALRLSLAGTRVWLLNVEQPLHRDCWFPEHTVPNFQAVASQRTFFATLARFAAQKTMLTSFCVKSPGGMRAVETLDPEQCPQGQ